MQTVLRPFTEHDYPAIVAIYNASWKGAQMTVDQQREQDEAARNHPGAAFQRYVVELDDQLIAFGCYDQPPRFYEPHRFRVTICVASQYQRQGIGSALYKRMIEDLRLLKMRSLWAKLHVDMHPGLCFAQKYGGSEELRVWELRLDTAVFKRAPYAALHAALHDQRIEIKTLQDLEADAERYQKLYQLTCEVGQDLPVTEHWVRPSYESFVKDLRRRSHATYFVAVHEQNYAGLSYMTEHPERQFCATGLTGVRRAYRRRGLALALKLQGIAYAQEHSYPLLTTSVDSSNLASLAMNERLGFEKWQTWIVLAETFSPQA